MTSATIEQLYKYISGTTQNVYPVTLAEAVFVSSGVTVSDELKKIEQTSGIDKQNIEDLFK